MYSKSNAIVSISIIVVTRGADDYLKSCLNSIEKQTYPPAEVIVIDNSLDKDFSRNIIECYPEIKLYAETSNTFYCEALNLGISQAKGDFILCLNDDVILDKSFIQESLKGFFIDSKTGMVSGKYRVLINKR
jgi:GT2 family glycosyltransferase